MAWWEYVIIVGVVLLCTRAITQAIGGLKDEIANLRDILRRDMATREKNLTLEFQTVRDQIEESERSADRTVREALSAGRLST